MTITEQIHQAVLKVPARAWTAAIEPGGEIPRRWLRRRR